MSQISIDKVTDEEKPVAKKDRVSISNEKPGIDLYDIQELIYMI